MRVTISDVWDRTIAFLRERGGAIVPIAVLTLLIPGAINGAFVDYRSVGAPATRTGLMLLSLALAIVMLWGQLAIASLAIDGRGASRATQRLLPAIGVYAVVLLAVLVVVGGPMLAWLATAPPELLQAVMAGQAAANLDAADTRALTWGSVLFVAIMIVLLFVLSRFAPLTGVIVAERRGLGAIGRAWRLTRGLMWRLVGVILLYAVVSWVAEKAVQTVLGSILRLVLGGEGPLTLAGVLTATAMAAVGAIFSVLATVFAARLYLACVAAEGAPASVPPVSRPEPWK